MVKKWTISWILFFSGIGDDGITKTHCWTTPPTWNRENSLETSGWFSEKLIHNLTDSDNRSKHEKITCQNLEAILHLVNSSKAPECKNKEKIKKYYMHMVFPNELITAKMMLYKKTEVMVNLPDDCSDFFENVTGFLQQDTLVSHLFILCLDYILLTLIELIWENVFTLE